MKATQLPSGKWRVQVSAGYDNNGKRIRRSFTAEKQSEAIKAAEDYNDGIYKGDNCITVKQAMTQYLNSIAGIRSETTIQGYDCIVKYRLQSIMPIDIHKLTRYNIQQAISEDVRTRHLGYKSSKESLGLLRASCALFDVNIPPTKKFILPPKKPNTTELEDLNKVIAVIMGSNIELPALISLSGGGMRASEVRGLQFKDVFTDVNGNHFIYINRSRVKVRRKDVIRNITKTEKSTRKVLIPEYVFRAINDINHENETDFIIPLTYDQLASRFKYLMKKHNIKLSFHGLRKLFATETTEMGIKKEIIQRGGGWTNSKVLDESYIKIRERDYIAGMKPYTDRIQDEIEKGLKSNDKDKNERKAKVESDNTTHQ